MFNSKIASLEARLARLEAVLKSRTASAGSKSKALTKAIKGIDTDLRIYDHMEVVNMIAESVQGVVKSTHKPDARYLRGEANVDNSVEVMISFGTHYTAELDLFVMASKRGTIAIEAYLLSDQIVNLSFKRGDNSWKVKVPALINKAKEEYKSKKSKTASAVSPESIQYIEENLHELLSEQYAYKGRAGAGVFVGDFRNHSMAVSGNNVRVEITVKHDGVDVHAVNSWHGRSEKKHFAINEANLDAVIMQAFAFVKSSI